MIFASSRDIKKNPAILWKNDKVVITVNGKPRAVVISISDDFEEIIRAIDRAMAQIALEKLRSESMNKGLDKLSDDDLESIIREIRNERSS